MYLLSGIIKSAMLVNGVEIIERRVEQLFVPVCDK